jgi:hypothetical protein
MRHTLRHRSFTTLLCLLIIGTPSVAAADELVLHDATPVRLRLTRNLSSADSTVGQNVDFEVLDDVKAGDVLVIARGATVIGTVTEAQAKRRMARGGKLGVNIDYVRLVDDEKAALRGTKEGSGGGHTGAMTGAMVATALVVWPAAPFFLFMHGKDITIPKGTEITAYVNGEIKLDPAKFAPKAAAQTVAPVTLSAPPPPSSAVSAPAQPSGGLVSISFVSSPENALVTFSGVALGRTPLIAQLMPGTYKIAIAADGFDGWSQDVVVEAGKPSTVTAMLKQSQR